MLSVFRTTILILLSLPMLVLAQVTVTGVPRVPVKDPQGLGITIDRSTPALSLFGIGELESSVELYSDLNCKNWIGSWKVDGNGMFYVRVNLYVGKMAFSIQGNRLGKIRSNCVRYQDN